MALTPQDETLVKLQNILSIAEAVLTKLQNAKNQARQTAQDNYTLALVQANTDFDDLITQAAGDVKVAQTNLNLAYGV